ncbi:MAG: hypothetical protein JST92_25775 [Deltaproteobacteria bacterium]|nr:hypothetical protein [Deltaproteobacteria bacterium]
MRPSLLASSCAVLAALVSLSVHAAAPAKEGPRKSSVVLVVPFSTGEDVPEWAGFALAELITDQFSQQADGSFVSSKQLDSVLRRKDLQLYDAADPEVAEPLAKALGATDLILGDVQRANGKLQITARRIVVGAGKESRILKEEATLETLPTAGATLAENLFDLKLKAGPMTANSKALEEASKCWLELVRHPLQPRVGTVAPLENADAVKGHCKAALEADPKFGLPRAGLAVLTCMLAKPADGRADAVEARVGRFNAMSYVAEAYCARREGNAAAARAALEAGIKARPGFLLALGYLGEEKMDMEDWKGALEAWDRYLKRAPNHPFALGQKAHALARLSRNVEALATTREALAFDPEDPELLIELASRQIDAKQEGEAENTLRKVMAARPPRPLAWLRMGYLYMKQNRAAEAKDVLTEAVTYAYREDEARVRGQAFADLAVVSGMQNNYNDAVQYLAAAKAEGLKDQKLPCGALEFKAYKGKPEFDAVCAGSK